MQYKYGINYKYHNTGTGPNDSQIRAKIDVRCILNDDVKPITTYSFCGLLQVSLLPDENNNSLKNTSAPPF